MPSPENSSSCNYSKCQETSDLSKTVRCLSFSQLCGSAFLWTRPRLVGGMNLLPHKHEMLAKAVSEVRECRSCGSPLSVDEDGVG